MNICRRPARVSFVLTALLLAVAAVAVGWGLGQWRKSKDGKAKAPTAGLAPKTIRRGELIFQTSCANCHGPEGKGDSDLAGQLRPPPRDFAVRPWRFEPTRDSIRRVILEGIPGTAMPANPRTFSEADLDALVDHVLTLSTSRQPPAVEPSLEEKLLQAVRFTDVRGLDPPPLAVTDAAGKRTKLGDLRGRLVILHFWGTTCVHCLKEMPGLQKLESTHAGRGLTVLHVCVDAEDAREAQALLDKHAPGLRGWTEENGLGLAAYQVQLLPTTWLIGTDGKTIARTSGAVHWHSEAVMKMLEHWLPAAVSR